MGRCLVIAFSRSRTLLQFWSGREEVGEEMVWGEGVPSLSAPGSASRGVDDGLEAAGELNPGWAVSTAV